VTRVGIEGSGNYGRCVADYLVLDWDQPGVAVLEVPTSPAEFRCNEIVRNIDDFNAAFDVNPGDDLWLDEA
jgi:hypothetical protein